MLDSRHADPGVPTLFRTRPAAAEDSSIAALVATYRAPLEALATQVVGSLAAPLVGAGNRAIGRNQETTAGNLVCDSLRLGADTIVSGGRGMPLGWCAF
jgi:2',3'-cyclic-nucleotide 2'-phosphodiesterase (5'-nucleotidase family)